MDRLVDVFYYDYILYKIIALYLEGAPSHRIVVYCKLANILNIEYTDIGIRLDPEVYLKTIFIKVLQLCRKEGSDAREHILGTMTYLMHLLDTEKLGDGPGQSKVVKMVSICYAHYFRDDPQANTSHLDFILRTNGTGCSRKMLSEEGLPEDFSAEAIFEHCRTLKFGRPVLFDFVQQVKTDIDQNILGGKGKKPKVDINRTSPGQKIRWD